MTTEPKRRIYSVDVSDGFEVYEMHAHSSFTENQIRAIDHIVRNAGKDPAPPVAPSDAPMSDADWVLLGRRMDGREMATTDKGVLILDNSIRRMMSMQEGYAYGEVMAFDEGLATRVTASAQEVLKDMVSDLSASGVVVSGEANLLSPAGGKVLGRVHGDGAPGQEVAVPLPYGKSIPVYVPKYADAKPPMDTKTKRDMARQQGFTGDVCTNCGGSSMKRNGSCLSCADCGSTTGCS